MNPFQARMQTVTHALAVLMVFTLIAPIALMNVVSFLAVLAYFLSGHYREKWASIKTHPLTYPALFLFGLFMLGVFYSSSEIAYALHHLGKYRELLLLPIAISIFSRAEVRQRAYYAFLLAIGVAVLVSFSMRLGWLPVYENAGEEFAPFRGRISFGFYLAFAIYLMLHHALLAQGMRKRLLWSGCAALSAFDLLFLISGRTGHFVLVALIGLLLIQQRARVKKYWLVILLVLGALTSAVVLTSPAIKSRSGDIDKAMSKPEESSIGVRLIFWQTSLRIIADHPLLGAGTGSFAAESAKHAGDHPGLVMDNPHNEYLSIAGQLGLLGLLGFIWLLYKQWKVAAQLPPLYGAAAQGLVVAFAVGCLFNSFLRDEGHFFAIYAGVLFSAFVPANRAAT